MASSERQSIALTQDYSYSLLPAGEYIRVLELLPGVASDPIHCHLNIMSLASVWRTYHAISYVWGNQSSQRDIFIENKRLRIMSNLWDALQHFRDEKEKQLLWADAICILQSHPPEKGVQVQLMEKIYAGASKVRVWLGPDTHGIAKETVDFIQETVSIAREFTKRYGSITAIPALSDSENPISKDRRKWGLYEQFLQLPWFRRVWVIQEVGVACEATMYWGDVELPFAAVLNLNEFMLLGQHLFSIHPLSWSLHDAFTGIFNYYDNPDSWRDQLITEIPAHWRRVCAAPSLSGVFIQGSRREVTDNRDLIYAFLGHPVAKRDDKPFVKPDYEKHVDEVYFDAMVRLLEWEPNPALPLAVAAGMGMRQSRDLDSEEIPTWVIRWELGLLVNWMGAPGHWHYAGGIEENVPKIDVDRKKKTLTMSGVIFDKVTWVSKLILSKDIALNELVANRDRVPALEWLWEDLKEKPCRYPEGVLRRDAMTVTLVAGRWPNKSEEQADAAKNMDKHRILVDGYSQYIAFAREHGADASTGNGSVAAQVITLFSSARDYEVLFNHVASNRRMFVTEKGFFGIGPPLLTEDDVVTVLEGVKVPFCLRGVERGEGSSFKLVGPAYVQGVMRGEVLEEGDPLGLSSGRPHDITIV
ncbi:HET-domain-containing protein [Lepidopterella palustris CBS 459.81]|uniref:HET-domain-containing protein n=1 Tax=Lepidopterella palustris CBS 459.81 TaxID=1314670 RepID=A0A8E2J9F9_9PEZI|nr:HET-domain-containing protein [Lepidopterella palustris CBS 459.81]